MYATWFSPRIPRDAHACADNVSAYFPERACMRSYLQPLFPGRRINAIAYSSAIRSDRNIVLFPQLLAKKHRILNHFVRNCKTRFHWTIFFAETVWTNRSLAFINIEQSSWPLIVSLTFIVVSVDFDGKYSRIKVIYRCQNKVNIEKT